MVTHSETHVGTSVAVIVDPDEAEVDSLARELLCESYPVKFAGCDPAIGPQLELFGRALGIPRDREAPSRGVCVDADAAPGSDQKLINVRRGKIRVCSICPHETALWFAFRLPGQGFSAIGYSVLASLAHMTGQFTLAWILFIPNTAIWRLFPVLLTAALLFGIISGIIARAMCNQETPCQT